MNDTSHREKESNSIPIPKLRSDHGALAGELFEKLKLGGEIPK